MTRLQQQIVEFGTYLDQWERTTGVECPAAMAAIHLDRIRASLDLPKAEPAPEKPTRSPEELLAEIDQFAQSLEKWTGVPVPVQHMQFVKGMVSFGALFGGLGVSK